MTTKITKEMQSTVKKGSSYKIDPREIIIDKEMNPRLDYGSGEEWESFKNSIRDHGIEQHIKISFDEASKKFHLVHGFRRMKAVTELIESGDTEKIELVDVDIVDDNKEAAVIGHFILNSAKSLNDAEMVEGLLRLVKYSGEENVPELARKTGLPNAKVAILLKFGKNVGSQVKKGLVSGELSFAAANALVNQTGSVSEQNRKYKEAQDAAKLAGKTKIKAKEVGAVAPSDKVSLDVKISNLMASLHDNSEVNGEAFNMFKAVIKALRENKKTEEIIPIFNLQFEESHA